MIHKTVSLADQIFDRLENDILTGVYQRGSVLTELSLSEDLGVSRTPIREAVRRLEQEHLVENAARVGEHLIAGLKKLVGQKIVDVRGRGLMIGIEFDYPYKEVRNRLLYDQHVFTGAAGTNVLRILPPLCIGQKECDLFLERFEKALK